MAHNNIESDRRSAMSSFYGGRKSSIDMLNTDRELGMRAGSPSGPAGSTYASSQRRGAPRDDASSFFTPQHAARPSAGYNRASFFDAGREAPVKGVRDEGEESAFIGSEHGATAQGEGAGWDVYADFNNLGPRYSTAFTKYDEGSYQRLPPDGPPSIRSGLGAKHEETASLSGPVELVTVPALGAEWKKSELEAMTKKGRKKVREETRWQNFRAWTRDQRGCWGRWGTRKQLAIGAFITFVIVGIILAFTVPRVPKFAFAASGALKNGTVPPGPETIFSRSPANFSFASNLDLQVDTGSSFLPTKFDHLRAQIFDLRTDRLVATGDLPGKSVPAKALTEIFLPLNFTYVATNDSDATWNDWYLACRNHALSTDGKRPGVSFRLELQMNIAGLIGTHNTATQITDANCPVELPENSV